MIGLGRVFDFSSVFDLVYPQYCISCDEVLERQEKHICWACLTDLEFTQNHYYSQNEITELLISEIPLRKAASFMIYKPDGILQQMIFQLKYRQNKDIGTWLGQWMALELGQWMADMDCIVPVPIHEKRKEIRGYNQSEVIAKGIANKISISVDTKSLLKKKNNSSQTRKTKLERLENVQDVYHLQKDHKLKAKNILLLDDVITTGSTTLACIQEIYNNTKPSSISVLYVASQNFT